MTPFVLRAIAAVRSWLGMSDPAENRLYASHGWLLPLPAEVRAHRLERLSPVTSRTSGNGR